MNKLSGESKEFNQDDVDDERINQLIARYSKILKESEDDSQTSTNVVSNSSRKKKYCTALSASRHNPSTMQVYPTKHTDCIYKIRSLGIDSNSSEGKSDSHLNIRILCEKQCYDSHSKSSDSSMSRFDRTYSNADHIALRQRNTASSQDHRSVDQQTSLTYKDIPNLKTYSEKTTYCRPIKINNDKHILHKLMERNAKLQLLLTKFVIARHREKEREKWNHYVSSLKIKSRVYRDLSTRFSSPSRLRQSKNPLQVNDTTNVKGNKLEHSDSYREMLHDLYSANAHEYSAEDDNNDKKHVDVGTVRGSFNSELHCFSNTSQVRRNSKEQACNNIGWAAYRTMRGSCMMTPEKNCLVHENTMIDKNIDVDLYPLTCSSQISMHQGVSVIETKMDKDTQTYITFGGYKTFAAHLNNDLERELEAKISQVSMKSEHKLENEAAGNENQTSLYDLHEDREPNKSSSRQRRSVRDLEDKLDALIHLFNSFVADLKAKDTTRQIKSNDRVVMCDVGEDSVPEEKQEIDHSNNTKKKKNVTIVGNAMTNTSLCAIESRYIPSHNILNTTLNKILYEELDKSNKLRSDIEAMLNSSANRPYPVQIHVDIPTRERSTEVTASLSRTKLNGQNPGVTIEDVSSPLDCRPPQVNQKMSAVEMRRCAKSRRIAVNTDPLGLLTLLNFSAEAVKQLLSVMLGMTSWSLGTYRRQPATYDYVCNICGAAFQQPSQLCAHILGHDFGQTRDCYVCRHAVDARHPSQLFRCRYCGQRFTRAYCCELHQQSCARRFGLSHDVGSSRAVLR